MRRLLGKVLCSIALVLPITTVTVHGSAGEEIGELDLMPLPKPPPRAPAAPDASDLKLLDGLLADLSSGEPAATARARQALQGANDSLIPAGAERLRRLAERADKNAMKDALSELRKEPSRAAKAGDSNGEEKDTTTDYLSPLLAKPHPKSEPWRNLVTVLGLAQMFSATANVEATRQIVQIYIRFGEFLRVDTQRRLEKLGLQSAAALIEASHHPAPKIATWARQQLRNRDLHKPSELVQRAQGAALADILRAYGYTRDPDLAEMLISFSGSSQVMIRNAAREGVAALGEVAHWPLRDAFERVAGKRPPREWSWERCAREVFRELDRTRLFDVLVAFRAGVAAHAKGAFDEMKRSFDAVLAQDPDFQHAETMARGYFDYARGKVDSAPVETLDTLRRARRLARDEETRNRIDSLLFTMEAEQLLSQGIADQVLLRRAIELDAGNDRARLRFAEMTSPSTETPGPIRRYFAAGLVGLLSALAAFVLIRRAHKGAALEPTRPEAPSTPD